MIASPPAVMHVACRATLPELTALVDGELSQAAAEAVEAHVAACAPCARTLAQLRALRTAVRRTAGAVPAPDTLRERIARGLDAACARRTDEGR